MPDKADERWRQKLDIRNPERRIGRTTTGETVFLDLREIFSAPGEDEERWHATIANRKKALVEQIAHLVLKNAALFCEQTFFEIEKANGVNTYSRNDALIALEYTLENGWEVIQDGLTTIVKKNGKILRSMAAKMPPEMPQIMMDCVAQRVKELVRKMPMPKE